MPANTTVKVYEKQLRGLMTDKAKYRQPYFIIIEGYQTLIEEHNLHDKLDNIMIRYAKSEAIKDEERLKKKMKKEK